MMITPGIDLKEPKVFQFDFDGCCKPSPKGWFSNTRTFSVGVFQWIPKKSGGLKRGKAIKRFKGYTSCADEVYEKARNFIKKLNQDGLNKRELK